MWCFTSKLTLFSVATLMVLAFPLFTSAAMANNSCPRPANQPTKAGSKTPSAVKREGEEEKRPKITLKPEASTEVINFGGTRGTKAIDVVLLASQPLPPGFSGKQLELDSPRRFTRAGQSLDSASLRLPRFSNPQVIEHRKKVRLRICVDTTEAPAGTYSGQIYISGPPRIASTSVALTVNVKTSVRIFWLFLVLALIVAFFLLLFKAAREEREGHKAREKAKLEGEGKHGGDPEVPEPSWREALGHQLKDPTFIVSTLVALGAALVAMRAIYDSTPAWGTESWTNFFALFGTAFGAAGVGSLISTFTPKSSA
jgi:hypothetical protein